MADHACNVTCYTWMISIALIYEVLLLENYNSPFEFPVSLNKALILIHERISFSRGM